MKREEFLRNRILDEYVSLRRFAISAGIPYSTLLTVLQRGIGGASFDLVLRICQELELDPGELGRVEPSECK